MRSPKVSRNRLACRPCLSLLTHVVGVLAIMGASLFVEGSVRPAHAFLDDVLEEIESIGDDIFGGYPDDKSDVCYPQQTRLAESGETFDQSLIRESLYTALTASAVSLVTSGSLDTNAAIQASIQAAGGYLLHMQGSGLAANQVVRQVRSDVRQENQAIDRVTAALDEVVACRVQEANAIKRDYRDGRIDRAEAEERMADVRERYDADVAVAQEIAEKVSARTGVYSTTYNQIAADNGANQLVVGGYGAGSGSSGSVSMQEEDGAGGGSGSSGGQQSYMAIKNSRVRAGPSTNDAIVGNLTAGDRVIVTGKSGNWYVISWGGGSAYVHTSLIAKAGAGTGGGGGSSKPPAAKPPRPSSVQVVSGGERPIDDKNVKPVKVSASDKPLVGELQEDCVTNVRKRDAYQEKVQEAKAAETSVMTLG